MSDNYRRKIVNLLETRGISVLSLENRLGFSNGYIRHMNDETAPYQRLKMIADAIGVSLTEIVSDKSPSIDSTARIGYEEFVLLQNERLVEYMKKIASLPSDKASYIYTTIDMIL